MRSCKLRASSALDLLGAEIDAGKAAAAHAFLRVIEQLSKLTGQLYVESPMFRLADEVDEMEERFERLAVAREVLAERRARRTRPEGEDSAKPNACKGLKSLRTAKLRFRSPMISRVCAHRGAKRRCCATRSFTYC